MLNRSAWLGEWLMIRRHVLMWIVAAAAIALASFAASGENPRTARELHEALLRLNLLIPVFILPFIAAALAPVFYLREVEHGMTPLFAAYPQTSRAWLTVRLGSFAALLIGICTIMQAAIVGFLVREHPDQILTLALQTGKLMALVHIPAAAIWAAVLARVSCAAGKASMVYLAAAFGWLGYIGLATMTGTPLIAGSFVAWEPLRTAMTLADPYAVTALVNPPSAHGSIYSREIAITLGRLGWLAVCFLLVRGIAAIPALIPARDDARPVGDQPLHRAARWQSPGYFALLMRWALLDKFFLLALLGWALLIFPEVFSGMAYAEQLSVLVPDSRDALNRVMWDMAAPLSALVLLYTADRVGRMASTNGMAELTAATPYPSWRFLTAQLACLWLVALALLAFTLAVVLIAQLAANSAIQLREYLEQGAQAMPALLLSASAFIAIHGVIRSRMAANLACFALIVLGHSNLAPAMGLIHPLWKPLAMPLAMPDQILGFSANWSAVQHYAPFWGAICVSAAMLALHLHHRGLPYRPVPIGKAVSHPAAVVAVVALTLGGAQGSAIHKAVKADGALVSADQRAARLADYERRYIHWQNRPQPNVSEVRSFVHFDDDGRGARLDMALTLVNRTGQAIDRILVGRNQIDVMGKVLIDDADAELQDRANGQTVFRLKSPMQAGDRRVLRFTAHVTRSAMADTASLLILNPEFGSLPALQIMPVIGFQRQFTMRNPHRRAEFGLPRLTIAAPSQLLASDADLAREQARFDTVLSLPRGRYAVAPGELVRSWSERGRSQFHYRTDRAIRNAPVFFALAWAPRQWPAGRLKAVIHAPGPIAANDPNLLAMQDTLAWLDGAVAPYPGKTLHLIAAPEFGSSGFALPQAVLISHRRGFRAHPAPNAGFNQAYRRAVHETAHQWFGHLVGYGIPEERAFLVESLAKYAELVMIERRYGTKAMLALVAWERDRLARARLAPAEISTPLIDAEDSEDMYSRATLAFACLRVQVGDAAIVGALREIATTSQRTGHPARSLDFVQAVNRASGAKRRVAIDQLFASSLPIETALAENGCNVPGR